MKGSAAARTNATVLISGAGGAALEVVTRMGLPEEIRARRTDVRGDTFGGRQGEDAEILRGDLNRMLYELGKGEVEYLLDDAAVGTAGRRVRHGRRAGGGAR
ncbi:hypothetical protein [Streptomyces sp. NPDC048340]|uniref:hypothetical protein n=1 Tax=Streptomyces sp. NPDC048340 TaxID=3365537 RepID=UPI00371AFB23